MKFRRFLVIALSVLMALSVVPAAALASEIGANAHEKAMLGLLDEVWETLDRVESEAVSAGADKTEVTFAVYKAALQLDKVDPASFDTITDRGFFFTVSGMACCYDYTASVSRNEAAADSVEPVEVFGALKNGPTNNNILLVGPYYGHDSSFTDQYRNEAQSLAQATGGQLTILQSTGATGPAIAAACTNAGIVIFDSHGTQSGNSSYLCLTTNSGITSTDYQNGWAVNAGSAAYIDGRYIQNHISGSLPNNLFWMAICEGMKRQGQGTTGNALITAGAAAVYGYSQSVTFAGDYEYEATFWNEMKEGAPVYEAIDVMKEEHGIPDPYGDAYPILMSPTDPFPANPDGAQNVTCDWTMYPSNPVALEDYSLSEETVSVYAGFSEKITFERIPEDANLYELEWHTENASVATVAGNNRKAVITGVAAGSVRVYADVLVDGSSIGRAYCSVTVLPAPSLNEAANVTGGTLEFTSPTTGYPWTVGVVNGAPVAMSGNYHTANSTSTMRLVISMQAGETLSFRWMASSEEGYDFLKFYVNNSQYGQSLSGQTDWIDVTYTANTTGSYTFEWRYIKDQYVDSNDDCGYVDDVSYSGAPIFEPTLGDVNLDGSVTAEDALLLLRYNLELANLNDNQLAVADVNGDGAIDNQDTLLILRMSLGLA